MRCWRANGGVRVRRAVWRQPCACPGLRVLGFERRAVIAVRVAETAVTILRILFGGRDLDAAFAEPEGAC